MLKLKRLQVSSSQNHLTPLSQEEMELLWGAGITYTVDYAGRLTVVTGCNGVDHDVVQASDTSYSCSGSLVVSSYKYGHDETGSQIEKGDYGLFKFLADNTGVEWAAQYNGGINPSDSTECFLQTSHQKGICNTQYGSEYDTFVHSHPADGCNGPSTEDEKVWKKMRDDEDCSFTHFGIYYVGKHTAKEHQP